MFKYILPVSALLAAPLAQSFEVKAGSWQFPHRISWQERESKKPDYVEGTEEMCVSRTAATDYAKSQAAELEADGCRIEGLQESGDTAGFRAACENRLTFRLSYQKLSDSRIRVKQIVANPQGNDYVVEGEMQHQNDDTGQCNG
ncbi:hypothetical protein [Neisseria dentiae]|uniref:hypothetical protein n=1 Tax=Neisseria dentiae TaxID=194197 RepID=UPI00359F4290